MSPKSSNLTPLHGLQVSSNADASKEDRADEASEAAPEGAVAAVGAVVLRAVSVAAEGEEREAAGDDAQHLVKLSYHDSGIDIRDPLLHVTPANSKKVSVT